SLVWAARRVAHHHRHGLERNVELLGDRLCVRRLLALPLVDASGEGGHLAVGVDLQPRVELAGIDRGVRRPGGARSGGEPGSGDAEADDERTAALQEALAGELAHFAPPFAITAAARLIASSTRMCVPHRQR